ncbi:MAG: OmpA family protein [Bacteroidales bacterium]
MKIFRIIALFVALVACSNFGYGQKLALRAADQAFSKNEYYHAIEKYKKAYKKTKDRDKKNDINFQIAECYRFTNQYKRLIPYLKRLIKADYQLKQPEIVLYYADALKKRKMYDDALVQYKAYNEIEPDDIRGTNGIISVEKIPEWTNGRSKYTITKIKDINSTTASDFSPAYISDNYNEIVFTSTRDGGKGKEKDAWTDQNFSDLFTAKKDRKGEWSTPVPVDEEEIVNSKGNEGSPFINDRGNTMYFTRCPNRKSQENGCIIMYSKRTGGSWGDPKVVEINGVDSLDIVGHPTLTADEKMIIFSGRLKNSFGEHDLYYAVRKSKTEKFLRPQNLGPIINTPGNEVFPFLKNDSTLFFSSDGHPGMGGLDIFVSHRLSDGSWGEPENLGAPINSEGDDFGIVFQKDSDNGFLSSNRSNSRGYDNIFEVYVPPLEFTISGTVKNERSLQFAANIKVRLVGSNGTVASTITNDKGFYTFGKSQVLPNTSYELIFTKENFFNTKAKETTVGMEGGKDFTVDKMIMPIPTESVVLPDILYDLAKWDLKEQYQDSLQGLITTLDENPNVRVELASHTDPRGSEESNDILSQKRAQSAVDYLVDRGIEPARLVAKGYGERVPRRLKKDIVRDGFLFKKGTLLNEDYINTIKDPKEKELAYELNRRTEFRVLSKNFDANQNPSLDSVTIVMNPDDNSVAFKTQAKTGIMIIPCNINGYTQEFYYEKFSSPSVNLATIKDWLSRGLVGKENFIGDAEKILAEGTVKNNSKFIVSEIRIANKVMYDVEFSVRVNQKNPIVFGQKLLSEFGKFQFDRTEKKLIFK